MRHSAALLFAVGSAASLSACDMISKDTKKQDTTVVVPKQAVAESAAAKAQLPSGVTAVPADSAAGLHAAADTGIVDMQPAQPKRGGVLFAFADGVETNAPGCTWAGAPLPCYKAGSGIGAIIALPADQPAGSFTLTMDRPGGRISRQVPIADQRFPQEVILLDAQHLALLKRGADIARDARAMRQILIGDSPQRRWSGAWREPVRGGRHTGYGADRFYYPATDSSRAIALDSSRATHGAFAGDTAELKAGEVASWRHTGVDIAVPKRTPVVASAAGIVELVGSYTLTGNSVMIDHGQGVHSAYFHLDTVVVKQGDVIRGGTLIGRVGTTGLTTGPHLHYAVYVHGKDVDPDAWMAMPNWVRGDSVKSGGHR
ncbi:MAG: M23 family metallopeptidase [Gemmatimonadota bacterium]|nr:M23 family metallopeptidase [Gemmatimonadota bacterium]